jgi:tRNA A37 threonylcarbamoyladenosine synthetase subunit TsaC/SUA5/YrdC
MIITTTHELYQYSLQEINHAIFLYPTDSLYGLWAVVNEENAIHINTIKQRPWDKAFSIIAPSLNWIYENCQISDVQTFKQEYEMRQQQYNAITIHIKKRDETFLNYVSTDEFLNIRIINHSMQRCIQKWNQPFFTTSANISWIEYNAELFPEPFSEKIDFYVSNDETMTWEKSVLINYEKKTVIPPFKYTK